MCRMRWRDLCLFFCYMGNRLMEHHLLKKMSFHHSSEVSPLLWHKFPICKSIFRSLLCFIGIFYLPFPNLDHKQITLQTFQNDRSILCPWNSSMLWHSSSLFIFIACSIPLCDYCMIYLFYWWTFCFFMNFDYTWTWFLVDKCTHFFWVNSKERTCLLTEYMYVYGCRRYCPNTFLKWLCLRLFPLAMYGTSMCRTPLLTLDIVSLLILAFLVGMAINS